MKVRIGVAIGGRAGRGRPFDGGGFDRVVDALDTLGFDSIWLPETFLGATVDPLVGLSYAAARTARLKLGTHLVAPGRNPFALAKALAQLDALSEGRLLLTFVAGIDDRRERQAQGLPTGDRTPWFDEHLPRLRRWWAGGEVDGLSLDARPRQDPLEVWLGGRAPKALVRAGRLGDGWLPGGLAIDDAVAGRMVVDAAAADAGRSISPEHFGTNLTYTPDAAGRDGLRRDIGAWVDAGFSKLVVRPDAAPDDWPDELARLAGAVLDLQT